MRGSRTSPIAKRARRALEIEAMNKLAPAESELHDVEPIVGISERELNLLDAYYHHLALDASEDPRPNTREEDADIAWLMTRARQRMSMSPVKIGAQRGVRPALSSWKR